MKLLSRLGLAALLSLVCGAATAQPYVAPTLVNIVDYGAICDNDDAHAAINSAAIQAAIDALNPLLGGIVEFPGNGSQCRYTDPVPRWNGRLHLGFKGAAVKGTAYGSGTALFYIGNGPRMLDMRESGGFSMEGITLGVLTPGYSGIMLDAGSAQPIGSRYNVTSYIRIIKSNFVNMGNTAPTCLNINFSLMTEIDGVTFGGCQTGILGAWNGPTGSEVYGDVNVSTTITNTLFFGIKGDAIKGCGASWTIGAGTVFEQQAVTGRPAGHVTSAARPCQAVGYEGAWFGDVTDPTGYWITLYCKGASIKRNVFGNVPIYLPDCSGWTADNNSFDGNGSIVCGAASWNGSIGPNAYLNGTPQPSAPCPTAAPGVIPQWQAFTGTITSQTGPYTTATWGGRYWYWPAAKTVLMQGKAIVTTVGPNVAQDAWLEVSLPVPAASTQQQWQSGGYYEGANSSQSGACITIPGFPGPDPANPNRGPGHLECRRADGKSPTFNGPSTLSINAFYEAQ